MKKRLNILFSTTRYGNVGDEFIMRGIENLLDEIGINFNKIIYNRNQEVNGWFDFLNPLRGNLMDKYSEKVIFQLLRSFLRLGFFDNSFSYKYYKQFKNSLDYVIWAGSPEWSGYRSKILFDLVNKEKIPGLMLGIGEAGHPWNKTKKWIKDGVKNQRLIILRNSEDFDNFKKLNKNTFQLSCPALFSALESEERDNIESIKNIGATFSFPKSSSSHSVKDKVFFEYIEFLKWIKKTYKNIKLYAVFHHIKDLVLFESDYSDIKELFEDSYYSGDREDYFTYYKNFDFVISTRVHGNGIASSLMIPNIAFTHDKRGTTVLGFGSYIYKDLDELKIIFNDNLKNISQKQIELKELKEKQKKQWKELLIKNLKNVK